MACAEQNESESYRIIVLSGTGAEVLLVPSGERLMLSSAEVPRWRRVAENVTAAVKSECGEQIVCLFEPATESLSDGSVPRYQAAEHLRACGNPKVPTRWVALPELCEITFMAACDYAAIRPVLAVCNPGLGWGSDAPFARLGWFRELRNWIGSVIEPMGC